MESLFTVLYRWWEYKKKEKDKSSMNDELDDVKSEQLEYSKETDSNVSNCEILVLKSLGPKSLLWRWFVQSQTILSECIQ